MAWNKRSRAKVVLMAEALRSFGFHAARGDATLGSGRLSMAVVQRFCSLRAELHRFGFPSLQAVIRIDICAAPYLWQANRHLCSAEHPARYIADKTVRTVTASRRLDRRQVLAVLAVSIADYRLSAIIQSDRGQPLCGARALSHPAVEIGFSTCGGYCTCPWSRSHLTT